MLKVLFIAALILTINGHPIDDESAEDEPSPKKKPEEEYETQVIHLQRDLTFVKYIETFKEMMAEYVKSQYKNLTSNEMDAVRNVLEEFLHNFASDLKDVIETEMSEDDEEVNDGIPDKTFDDVKVNIKNEFPNINEESVDKIVQKLRKNLLITRQKLDSIIRNSGMAAQFNT